METMWVRVGQQEISCAGVVLVEVDTVDGVVGLVVVKVENLAIC